MMTETVGTEPTVAEGLIQTARASYTKDSTSVIYVTLPSAHFEEVASDEASYFTIAGGEGQRTLSGEGMVIQEGSESPGA